MQQPLAYTLLDGFYTLKRIYKFVYFYSMWRKHAVWTQCALTMPMIMSIATCMSWQHITLWDDMYWSVIFMISTAIQFCAAEHGDLVITVDTWHAVQKYRTFVVYCIIASWTMLQLETRYQFGLVLPFVVLSIYAHKHHRIILIVAIIAQLAYSGPWIWTMATLYAEYMAEHNFSKSIQGRHASIWMRKAYACIALTVLLEALTLWSIRCQYRFPYTFRWAPIVASAICLPGVITWTNANIKDTEVSQDVTVKSQKHRVAASITAAKQCESCRACLTSLDMESSFATHTESNCDHSTRPTQNIHRPTV